MRGHRRPHPAHDRQLAAKARIAAAVGATPAEVNGPLARLISTGMRGPGQARASHAARLRAAAPSARQYGWVAESLDSQLLRADFDVECPECRYPIWVTGAEVVAQSAVTCPCCRTRTWLRDEGGSFQNAGQVIEQQINDALKDLWR